MCTKYHTPGAMVGALSNIHLPPPPQGCRGARDLGQQSSN